MSAGYITIATVEPYHEIPAVPVITGQKTIWAPYIVGCLAAYPTSYAATCPDEMLGDPEVRVHRRLTHTERRHR
jgi:hypothetical protein